MNEELKKISEDIRRFDTLTAELRKILVAQKLQVAKEQRVICASCKESLPINHWIFIQEHWYERAYGCTDGDIWHGSDTKNCHIICPLCQQENYLYNHKQREEIIALADDYSWTKEALFAGIKKRYNGYQN